MSDVKIGRLYKRNKLDWYVYIYGVSRDMRRDDTSGDLGKIYTGFMICVKHNFEPYTDVVHEEEIKRFYTLVEDD